MQIREVIGLRKAAILGIVFILILFPGATAYGLGPAENAEGKNTSAPRIDQLDFPALYLCQPNLEGEAVWIVQARLRELGFEIEPDGRYSSYTSYGVKMFQLAHAMKDDGVVTPQVWKELMAVESAQPCLSPEQQSKERLLIVIDVKTRNLVVYQNDFGTRWLGLNVPWGIFGIHGTNKPYSIGSYASHGCIRMFNRDVEKLYPLIPVGTTVRIVDKGKMFPENLKPVALKKGSSGQRVVYVQSRLKELGIELDKADGRYGNMTELAVKYFQVWHDLDPSGEMDEETYRAMCMIK